MEKYHITLTEDERSLLAKIDLRDRLPPSVDGHEVYKANREPIVALLKSLLERGAVPKQRWAYFTDPAYKPGRAKGSRRDIFEGNGNHGKEVYEHPHFVPYFRYILFGTELPDAAVQEFEDQVGDPRWFSGSDILELTKKTREIVRRYNLRTHEDEFYKLAIDLGLNTYHADSLRRTAKEAARR